MLLNKNVLKNTKITPVNNNPMIVEMMLWDIYFIRIKLIESIILYKNNFYIILHMYKYIKNLKFTFCKKQSLLK